MRRRQVLAALGTSIVPFTGCLSTASPGDASETTPTSESPPTDFPTVSVRSDYEQPSDATVIVDVIRQFSPNQPAKIKISYTNTAASRRTVDFQASPPFSEYMSAAPDSPRLAIIPDDHSHIAPGEVINNQSTQTESPTESRQLIPDTPIEGCWIVPTAFAVYGVAHPKTLSSGETVAEEYTVLGYQTNTSCLPSGEYGFEQDRYFGEDNPWGFTIELSR